MALQKKIDAIVERRNARVPWVTERIELLNQLQAELDKTVALSQTLSPSWLEEPELDGALSRLRSGDISAALAEARMSLEALKARFSRETINIGVAGRARVGKSTLLQSVSGLTDDQVPTGDAGNVTAVRSQIFHAPRQRAIIQFYSQPDFFDARVQPYFGKLNAATSPTSLDEFLRFNLDSADFLANLDQNMQTTQDSLRDLKMLQAAVPKLLGRLDGGEITLNELSDLRRYVAYPSAIDGPRDYLTVKDVRIESPFPVTAVSRLGLIDLPGLGESDAGLEQRVAQGLRGDVDAVLLLKRSATGLAMIDDTDSRAMDIIVRARGEIEDSRDFAWAVINTAPGDEGRVKSLKEEIQHKLNRGEPDSRILTVESDATSASSVDTQVLQPVLERLANRLDNIDKQLTDAATLRLQQQLLPVESSLATLVGALRAARSHNPSVRQELYALAEKLRMDIQRELSEIGATDLIDEFVSGYHEQLSQVHSEIKEWLAAGLGTSKDKDAWRETATGKWGLAKSHGPFANEELHRLRVAVTKRYAALDAYLNDELVNQFYERICAALEGAAAASGDYVSKSNTSFAPLLGDSTLDAENRILKLIEKLDQADPPVGGLLAAFRDLVGIKFDFRLQAYPLLSEINAEMLPQDAGDDGATFPPTFPPEATDSMYDWFTDEFTSYSYRVQTALAEDALRQFQALTGALSLLEDEVARAGSSKQDFEELVFGYRDELWPGMFDDRNSKSAGARALATTAQSAYDTIRGLEGEH